MSYLTIFTTAVGGLGLFLYGMYVLADGLQKLAGGKMKQLLEFLTRNRFFAVLVGAAVTAVIQSSSATTVMVVGFVNAQMMSLTQAVGVIMGANIGTTATAWLVSSVEWASALKPDNFAPVLMAIGACLVLFTNRAKLKEGGAIAAGFGMLFIGMNMMSSGLRPLAENEWFRQLFVSMGTNPLLGVLAGVIVTGVIQSSSASVGILQSLAIAGLVPWNSAVYIIMGQNIGTCVTAMLSAMGAKRNAKAAAYTHLMFNVMGSCIFTPLAIVFFKFFDGGGLGDQLISATEIGIVHTSFNVACTVILFGFGDKLVWIASRMARFTPEKVKTTEAIHLDERVLNSHTMAIDSVTREIARLGHMALDNVNAAAKAVKERDKTDLPAIQSNEKTIDRLTDEIKKYLVAILSGGIGETETAHVARLTNICERIERVGDHAENISEVAEYLVNSDTRFSDAAIDELNRMFKATSDCFEKALVSFESGDKDLAAQARALESEVDDMKEAFRVSHIGRLAAGACANGGDAAFLDLLTDMERITDHANNMAKFVLGKADHAKANH